MLQPIVVDLTVALVAASFADRRSESEKKAATAT
jgi:hypothetical protein